LAKQFIEIIFPLTTFIHPADYSLKLFLPLGNVGKILSPRIHKIVCSSAHTPLVAAEKPNHFPA
jgi:hypothetical protein